jgi:hypothetical protein
MSCPSYPTGSGGLSLQRAYETGNRIEFDISGFPNIPSIGFSSPQIGNYAGESTSGLFVYGDSLPATIAINNSSWITFSPNTITFVESPSEAKNTTSAFSETFEVDPSSFSEFQNLSPASAGLVFPGPYQWAITGTLTIVESGSTPVAVEFIASGTSTGLTSQSALVIGTGVPLTANLTFAGGLVSLNITPTNPGTYRSSFRSSRFIGF